MADQFAQNILGYLWDTLKLPWEYPGNTLGISWGYLIYNLGIAHTWV